MWVSWNSWKLMRLKYWWEHFENYWEFIPKLLTETFRMTEKWTWNFSLRKIFENSGTSLFQNDFYQKCIPDFWRWKALLNQLTIIKRHQVTLFFMVLTMTKEGCSSCSKVILDTVYIHIIKNIFNIILCLI